MNKDIIYVLTEHKVKVSNDIMIMELRKNITKAIDIEDYKAIYNYILKRYPETIKENGNIVGIFMDEKVAESALNNLDIEFSNYDRGCFITTFYEINQYGIDTEYHKSLIDNGYNIKEVLSECEFLGLHSRSVIIDK